MRPQKAACCTTVDIPISDTPKNIEFTIINDSAKELDIASSETFISSAPMSPFFLIMSIAGFIQF